MESRWPLAADWQHPADPLNVSDDIEGFVTPIDALLIINELNLPQIGESTTGLLPPLNPPTVAPPPFLDVDADGYVSPIDAVRVINGLREPSYDQGSSATQTYRLSVGQPAANAGVPIIQSTPATIAVVDALYLYLPLAQDADGDPLVYSLVTSPATMSIESSSGRIEWTPEMSQVGAHPVVLRVDDGRGGFATQLFTIDVVAEAVNRPPLITTTPGFVASQAELYAYDVDALDPDGDPIAFAVIADPPGMTVDATAGLLSFTPDVSQLGTHRVRLVATDTAGATGFQTFDLDVRGTNTPPVLSSLPPTQATAGVVYRYRAVAEDAEDAVLLSLVAGPETMTIDPRTGVVRFAPSIADIGDHAVTIRAADDRGAMADQTYVLTVTPDVEPPEVSLVLSNNLLSPTPTASSPTRVIDPDGTFRTVENNQLGLPTQLVDGSGRQTNLEYDQRGRLVAIVDGLGHRSTFEYNASLLTRTTDALGRVTQFEYDAAGRLVREIDPLGGVTAFTYDDAGNLLSRSTNPTTLSQYDAAGNVTAIIDPNGHVTQFEYDALQRVIRRIDPLQGERTLAYDAVGNAVSVRDENGNTTQFEYDVLDRLVRLMDPLGQVQQRSYDAAGNLASMQDARGNLTQFQYDGLGRIVRVDDAAGGVTQLEYDGAGRILRVVFAYDQTGNLIAMTDRNGARRAYDHDAMNRMTAERWLDSGGAAVRTIQYSYDALGNLLTAADPDFSASYTYGALSQLTDEVVTGTAGLPDYTMHYVYDPNGNLLSQSDHQGGTVSSTFTPTNLLASRSSQKAGLEPLRVDFRYDVRQDLLEIRRVNDLAATQPAGSSSLQYDAKRRLTQLTHHDAGGNALVDYNYVRDAADRLASESHHGQTTEYRSDGLGQVLGSTRDGLADESFEYDLNGNRLGPETVLGPNNRIDSDGLFRYEYDAAGNLLARTQIADGARTEFAWDHRQRLIGAQQRSSAGELMLDVAYTYDVFDRRVAKVVDPDGDGPLTAETERFWYSGDSIWADLDASDNVSARYLHGSFVDERMARQRPGEEIAWYWGGSTRHGP